MKSRHSIMLAVALGVSALFSMARAQEERIVWPGGNMNLEGTRRGPHYVCMTKQERERYVRHMTSDPEGRKEFAAVKARADGTIAGDVNDRKSLVLAYLVTRDKKYFDAWRNLFLAEANRLNTLYPTPMDMAKAYGPRNHFIWGKRGWSWDYDMMAGYLSDNDEKLLRWQLKKYCDALRIWKVDRKNVKGQSEGTNMAARTISITSPQWFAIGYDDCIDWSISHEPGGGRDGAGGLLQWMRPMRDKRVWGEAPIYQWYVGEGILPLAACAWRYDGRDVWSMVGAKGTMPRNVVDGAVDMAFPLERTGIGLGCIRMANFGEEGTSLWQDQWLNFGGGGRACWQPVLRSVYRASGDKGYGWLASVNRGFGDPSSEAPINPDEVSPPPAPCSVWPTAGMAMFRADESPDYWMGRTLGMQVMGGERRRSAPGDSFSIRLHGAGRLLYPDWIMTYYEVYTDVGWERSGTRRSSVMIDGRETSIHRTFWRHAFSPDVKYLSLRGSRYGHDRSERAFMMTKEYLLDVFDIVVGDDLSPDLYYYRGAGNRKQYRGWSRAGLWDENGKLPDSHTFDYILHGIGRQFPSHWWRFDSSSEFTAENWPNRWLTHEKKAALGAEPFHVDWVQRSGGLERRLGVYKDLGEEWFKDKVGVRMHMLGSPDTVVYTLQAPMGDGGHHTERELPRPPTHVVNPDEHPEMTIKTLVVRRRGKAAQFVAVHEPYRDRPAISRVEYLHRPAADEAVRAVGVKVAGPDYVDRLYVTLGLPGYTMADGVQGERVAPAAEAPRVTVTSDGDPSENVRFAGQAYLRQKGRVLTVRGDVKAFCVRAPAVKTILLNGTKVAVRRAGEYLLFGDAKAPVSKKGPAAAPEPAVPKVPVDIALPQRNVNIDATKGGWMVVRVTNRTDAPVSGTVTVKPGKGLSAPAARRFAGLPPEHRIDLGFELKPDAAKSGTLVPMQVTVEAAGGRSRGSRSISTQVAVGVVVEEVRATYSIPLYDYAEGKPGRPKPKSEWLSRKFDYIRVRAPGYTLRVDKFSGGTRWIMDPTGLLRTSLAAYPYGMARVDEWRYMKGRTLSGPWLSEAKYMGASRDDKGDPTLEFSSLDGKRTWRYVLTPYSAGSAARGTIDAPGVAEPNGLGFKVPKEPWWQEEPVSVWPSYELEERAEPEERKNLLAGLKPTLQIPPEVQATGGVYWDEQRKVDGLPALCFDLDKLRGLGSKKYQIRLNWPVTVMFERRYRFAFKMRHENVTNLVTYEPVYTSCSYSGLANWVSKEANDSIYWPRRVREWFLAQNRVATATSSCRMTITTKVPGDPEQTGKIWLGGFSVEEAE